jgi:DNA primase
MPYPHEVLDEVRTGNDIVDVVGAYVTLRPQSNNHFGLCPFHNENTPSFSVNRDKQIFYCFGCQAGGNVISFIMRIENYDFMDALRFLADRIHYVLPQPEQSKAVKQAARSREKTAEINQKAARFFYDYLQGSAEEAVLARSYLDKRGIPPLLRRRFGLGLSPAGWDGLITYLRGMDYTPADLQEAGLAVPNKRQGHHDRFRERLMFPIMDLNDRVIGFGGRILEKGEPKYLNSPETPLFDKKRHLYGLLLARKAKAKEIIIVEGYMDVIGLHRAGFINTAGVLGTALSADHARLIKRINCESVILLMDSDQAGTNAALRAIPVLLAGGLKVRVLQVTEAKDPDEYIRQYGAKPFAKLLETAQNHINFRVDILRKQYNLRETDQRVAFTQEAAAILATLSSAIETDAYTQEIAAATGISPDAILAETQKQRGAPSGVVPLRPLRTRTGPRGEHGLREARKGLINLALTYSPACRALKESRYLSPEEMGDELSRRLLELAFENVNPLLAPADIITRFETIDEQQKAAEILNLPAIQGDTEKNVNAMAFVIKLAWLDRQIETNAADANAVNTLFERKRNLHKQYITIPNG